MKATFAIIAALALFAGLVNGQAACTPGSGNVVILTSMDQYNQVKDCVSMVGLQIQNQAFTGDLVFAKLTTLTRPISISNSSITSLSMPLLTSINGATSITQSSLLETIEIGAATGTGVVQAGGDVNLILTNLPAIKNIRIGLQKAARIPMDTVGVEGNTGTFSLPFLASVNTQFSITNSKFGTVSLPLFANTLGFLINNNAIGVLNVPLNLTTVSFSVNNNKGFTSVTVNPISVGTTTSVTNFVFSDNAGTGYSLNLPSLKAVFGNFQVLGNRGLVGISVAKPFGCKNLTISDNDLNNVYIESVTCSDGATFTNNKPTAGAPGTARLGLFIIGGSVSVFGNNFDTISFPILRAVAGTVSVTDNDLVSVTFPSTFVANGTLTFVSNRFTGQGSNLDISGLQATLGSLLITGNTNAGHQTDLIFRDLQVVAQQFLIDNNNFVKSISVPNLSIVGALSGGSVYTGADASSFIVRNNVNLLTFTGSGTSYIIVGNLTISNNAIITNINANSLGQAGAVSVQNNPELTTYTGTGLICAAVVEFNAVPKMATVTLTSLSSIEKTVVIAQGEGLGGTTCTANINSTSGGCVGGTPACYNCETNNGVADNCGESIPALSVLCGTSKSFCPTARALSLINVGDGGTNTVDGAGTYGSGAGTGTQSSSSTLSSEGGSSTPATTRASSAISNVAALFVVLIALFAGF